MSPTTMSLKCYISVYLGSKGWRYSNRITTRTKSWCVLLYPHFGPKNYSETSFLYCLPLMLFKFTVFTLQFSTMLQMHIVLFSVSNFPAYQTIQSVFLALRVVKKGFLKALHIFLHFIPIFCIKSYEKGILVISYRGTHFSPYNLPLGLFNLSA